MAAINERLDLMVGIFKGLFPDRVVDRNYEDVHSAEEDDLTCGTFSFMFKSEGGYRNELHRRADTSAQKYIVIARMYLKEGATGEDVEKEELAMIEEMKSFIRSGLPSEIYNLSMVETIGSAQAQAPLAWVLFELELTD
jgi:hypothetical protein